MRINLSGRNAAACLEIAEDVAAAGGRAFLVGGCVRDAVLGKTPKDLDLEVYGIAPSALEGILGRKFRVEMVGKSFGVWIVKGFDIDVSIPRRERKTGDGHKAFDVECDPFLDVKTACSRRDFTVNAMLFDPLKNELIDPYSGMADLRAGVLRHTSEAFAEDPLRVLRAMQFAARFDMAVAPETVSECAKIGFENLPPERVFEEWKKLILKGSKISRGLRFLRDCGWIKYFPELAATVGCPQDPQWHPEGDVFEHTCLCMDFFAENRIGDEREDITVGFAVLCHDFGKPLCTKEGADGKIHSYGHDILGEKPAVSFMLGMTREKALVADVATLVARHMAVLDLWRADAGDSAIRRLARKVGRIDRLVRVDEADRNGRGEYFTTRSPQGAWIMEKARRLAVQDSAPKPLLMGRHLLEMGVKAGREMGKILDDAYEAQLDGAFSDIEGAKAYVHKLLEKNKPL